ncbi:MAG: YraN family protein [Armatimonadetes bacterium]|nr:YraN family protein [Armatimonadota bacterium]
MPTARALLGKLAEERAAAEMERLGYEILETNYRCRFGEIDVIARKQDTLVFIEVRSRRSIDPCFPTESVDERKQAKLVLTAQHYLSTHGCAADSNCRFDVAAVRFQKGKPVTVELVQNAFGEG